jgi:hypothetical protein
VRGNVAFRGYPVIRRGLCPRHLIPEGEKEVRKKKAPPVSRRRLMMLNGSGK